MEAQKIKTILLLISIVTCCQSYAQRIWDERAGCINAQGNLAPGYLFQQKNVSAYVDGDVEVLLTDRFALTGAAWISFATSAKDQAGLKANHAIFWGADYHFLKPSRWDPYIGFTPGLGLTRAAYYSGEGLKMTPFTIAPLGSVTIGCNYYVGSLFHFFVRVQGVTGQMFSTLPVPKRLDELKFMAGLAFNLRLWKSMKHNASVTSR